MATLVIKNVPDELHDKLKQQAREHRRSLAKETLTLLEQAVSGHAPPRKRLPTPVRLSSGPLSDDELETLITGDRD